MPTSKRYRVCAIFLKNNHWRSISRNNFSALSRYSLALMPFSSLYIQLRAVDVDDNIDIEEGISVDLDENRHVVGIEILDASRKTR
jgi:hypothetical protein